MAEEGLITLKCLELQLMNYRKEDVKKKMGIAANVFRKCDQKQFYNLTCAARKSHLLTGVPITTLEQISLMEQKCKKFNEWLHGERRKALGPHDTYRKLRSILIYNYTKQFEIPTNLSNVDTGRKQFCMSLQIPGTKNSIIVEKPETVVERHRFIYQKMMHREAKRHIVYIGKVNLHVFKGKFSFKEDLLESKNRFLVAASPTLGYISHLYISAHNLDLINWIKNNVEPELPQESVIIFQENVLGTPKTIDSYSSKEQMSKWLESKDIPHDPKMHHADLFKLIQKCRASDTGDLTSAEETLRARGHITMRKKKCNLDNNYLDPFWIFLIDELNSRSGYRQTSYPELVRHTANLILRNSPEEYWRGLEYILLEAEELIYKEDLEMEHIIDRLMTMAKNEGLSYYETQEKLEEYSKRLSDEHFFGNEDLMASLFKIKVKKDEEQNYMNLEGTPANSEAS